jgi:hypothetical protein
MKRRRPEDEIQRAVFQHLAARPAQGVFAFHVPNGGQRSPIEAAILKGLGVKAGVPDVIAIRQGQVYGLELKAPRHGRLSPAQRETIPAMERAGCICRVATGLDEALAALQGDLVRGRVLT